MHNKCQRRAHRNGARPGQRAHMLAYHTLADHLHEATDEHIEENSNDLLPLPNQSFSETKSKIVFFFIIYTHEM